MIHTRPQHFWCFTLSLALATTLACESTPAPSRQDAPKAIATQTSETATPGSATAPAPPNETSRSSETSPSTTTAAPKEKKQKPPAPTPDDSVTDYDTLVRGKPRAEFIDMWGEPTRGMTFKMGDGVPEFRIELYNDFRPKDPATADVQIQEDTWVLDGYSFTLWSHEKENAWIALQAVSYNDGVSF